MTPAAADRSSPTGRALGLVLLVSLAALGARNARGHGEGHYLATRHYEDLYYLPPPEWLQVVSLGQREALAGLIWLQALVYFGEDVGHGGSVAHLYDYADAMLALDPQFKKVYRWVASGAIYRPGFVKLEHALTAIAYLERAVRLWPDDGELAWDLGANYVYELVPLLSSSKEKATARMRGVEHLRVAALRGFGPAWLAISTASEFDRLGRTEQLIRYLEELYPLVSDPQVKGEIERRLAKLRSEAYAEALRRTAIELEQAHQRDFPYLDPSLYLLVGPRPPFDGDAFLARRFDPEAMRFEEEIE